VTGDFENMKIVDNKK